VLNSIIMHIGTFHLPFLKHPAATSPVRGSGLE
jgi:hypothetical protein